MAILMLLHATCIVLYEKAVLLVGPAGIGKSDLALRLIDSGAKLIADDQTLLTRKEAQIMASAPAALGGLMEIRQVGLIRVPFQAEAPVGLYVDLCAASEVLPRLPEKDQLFLLDHPVKRLRLPSFLIQKDYRHCLRIFLL